MKEDELPPGFDPEFYLLINTDVALAGVDPADHYLRYGRREGRPFSRRFDAVSIAHTDPVADSAPSPPVADPPANFPLAEANPQSTSILSRIPHLAQRLSHGELYKTAAIIGSGTAARDAESLLGAETIVVALNNAWRATSRLDYWVYADDFPNARKPPASVIARAGRSAPQYLPAMEACGGVLYCGASSAFGAGYWLIRALPSTQISYFAADMIYHCGQPNHFYGEGTADPLRRDISLQDHGAKCLRLFYFGLEAGCLLLNASASAETRLMFPRVRSGQSLARNVMAEVSKVMDLELQSLREAAASALALERAVDFDARALDYSHLADDQRAWRHVATVDAKWRALGPAVGRIEAAVSAAFARAARDE